MNKTLYLIATLVIAGLLAAVTIDVWRSHDFIKTQGIEGTLRIGQRYNASRWAEPLPLKKIHAYTATLAPRFEVIVESDQYLTPGKQVFIRHLELGGKPAPETSHLLRPLAGSIRLRTEADGAPAKIDPTAPLNQALDKAMGTPAASSRTEGSTATNPDQKPVAFLIGGANDGLFELIWNNSRAGEWVLLLFVLFLLQAFAVNAWTLPWREYKPLEQDKEFVHPSLEQIEPDAPRAPAARITLKLKPAVPEPEASVLPEPVSTNHVLKLPRK
jgi:hypothetical protein